MKNYLTVGWPFFLAAIFLMIFACMSCNTIKKNSHSEVQNIDSVSVKKATISDIKKVDSLSKVTAVTRSNSIDSTGLIITFDTSAQETTSPLIIERKPDGTITINPGGRKLKSVELNDKKESTASTKQTAETKLQKSDSTVKQKSDSVDLKKLVKIIDTSKETSTPWWVIGLKAVVLIAVFAGIVYLLFCCTVSFTPIPPFLKIKRKA